MNAQLCVSLFVRHTCVYTLECVRTTYCNIATLQYRFATHALPIASTVVFLYTCTTIGKPLEYSEYFRFTSWEVRRSEQGSNDMPRHGGDAVGVGRAVVDTCKSPHRLPKRLCPRPRNTINTLPTLPAVAYLALVVWLSAITTNAQTDTGGAVNQGTDSMTSGR